MADRAHYTRRFLPFRWDQSGVMKRLPSAILARSRLLSCMPGSLVLVRHGPSAHIHRRGTLDSDGVRQWRVAYDAAGLLPGAGPEQRVVEIAAAATHIVSSELRRAVASAALLAPGRPVRTSALLRETPLPIPNWRTRFPLEAWDTFLYLAWRYRLMRGTEPDQMERARVVAAAELLVGLVADGSSACVVTHGAFRLLLSQRLRHLGWHHAGRRGGYGHWSTWSFTGPGANDAK